MFSISHDSDGSFRLEIHGSPSDLEARDARRLRAVLLKLAREVDGAVDGRADGRREGRSAAEISLRPRLRRDQSRSSG